MKKLIVGIAAFLVIGVGAAACLRPKPKAPVPDAPVSHVPTERVILPSAKLKAGSSGMECPNCYFPVPGRVARNGKPFTAWNFCPRCGCKFVKE